MNNKPATFDETVSQYNGLIKNQIKRLRIYKHFDEYYQEGLIALWEAYQRHDESKGSFSNYAFHTVRGKMLTKLKRESSHESRQQPSEEVEVFNQIYEPNLLQREVIESYCKQLSPNQQKVIIGRFYEDKTFEQIAAEEGVQPATVRSWYRYAFVKLKKQLGEQMEDN